MTHHVFEFHGETLQALAAGALYWPARRVLAVADLHLGKGLRGVRRGAAALPPYEAAETLARLDAVLALTAAAQVICLGDTFDAPDSLGFLPEDARLWLIRMQAGRDWVWITGNHDPGPVELPGAHLDHLRLAGLTFRHIAEPAETGEISGHYHPKARLVTRAGAVRRACFLIDADRIILPAFGAYTGGLDCTDPTLDRLMGAGARAVLTGPRAVPFPMPRPASRG